MLAKAAVTSAVAISSEPTREEYADALFADRDDEIKIVESKIAQAQVGKIERPVIEMHAVKGQGKSWLVQRIFNFLMPGRKKNNGTKYPKPALTAYIDFEKLVDKPGNHPFSILKTLAQELQRQSETPLEIPSLKKKRAFTKKLESAEKEFTQFVQSLVDHFVPILIFDSTDRADEQVLEWLEDHLVFPLIHSDQIIFVFAGRRRLFWRHFEIRRRVDAHELLPLDEEGSAEQLRLRNQDSQVGRLLFRFSKGHPEINWRILYGLQYDQGVSILDQGVIESNHSYILDRVREIIDSQFLVGLSKEAFVLLWDVCVLRRFHTAQLRYFAGVRNEKDKKRPEGDYLDLIQQMIDVALVHWDSDEGGYVLDATVRAVMLENLKERDSERFVALQKDALGLYLGWVVDYPENSQHYLLEIVYHEGILLTMGQRRRDEFLQEFAQILANPKLPDTALDETAFPRLLREDGELAHDLFHPFPELRGEILARAANAREAKSREQ